MELRNTCRMLTLTAAFAGTFAASAAFAVDGVIEINAASAAVGGITPGDTPGFPVTISEEGSYRLTGNLSTDNSNVDVIRVTSSFVNIDLNGFVISGPGKGTGSGVVASAIYREISVRNGTIREMGNGGVRLPGGASLVVDVIAHRNEDDGFQVDVVRDCIASFNGDTGIVANQVTGSTAIQNGFNNSSASGIFVGNGGLAMDNVSSANQGEGITSGRGATISGNTIYDNGEDGIRTGEGSLVRDNAVRDNALFGLNLGANSGYGDNVLTNNGSGSVSGGLRIGTNVCGTNTTCP
ncbi:MAG: right-handed parallel beta-helix repeat-containing protein [Acidobacteriota bacterium]